MVYQPKGRLEIYTDMATQVLFFAPVTSSELGDVIDNILSGVTDCIYECYFEQSQALALLSLDTITGSELDDIASDYPSLKPRFEATYANGNVIVTDPDITKVSSVVSSGGGFAGQLFINIDDTTSFPSSGTVMIGNRVDSNFEYVTYTNKNSAQLNPTSALAYDHASSEPVVLATVGDRVFPGPFSVKTRATTETKAKTYTSISPLTIYDGEEFGEMTVQATESGPVGNTPSNTIIEFVGVPPFPTAELSNGTALENGTAEEGDPELRARIRQEKQALSTANVDAIYSILNNVNLNGQKVVFKQIVEDPDPTLPGIVYIDDGAAFTPTQESISTPIVIVDEAIGGEQFFRLDRDALPIVTTDLENSTRIFSNITLEKNGVPMTQGDAAGQYRVQPDQGNIRIVTPLVANDNLQVTALTHYSGLIQETSKTIYGDRNDREAYPGRIGLGTWLQVRNAQIQYIDIEANAIFDGSRDRTETVNEIRDNWIDYVNSLGIGGSVVLTKLVYLGMVRGVNKIVISLPTDDVVIPSGYLARLLSGNITLS